MSTLQHSQISQAGDQYDPNLVNTQDHDNMQYDSSSESDYSDDDMIAVKKGSKYQGQGNSNKVYHQNQYTKIDQKLCLTKVQACENQQLVKEKKNKDKVQRATVEQVLDPRTMTILKKLITNGTFTEINGCLSTGKEANVYYALRDNEQGKKQYAIKIYKTSILVFKDRERYVQGEFRWRKGYCSNNPRKMVKMWAQKQLRNLNRIQGIIPCPSALLAKSNVLVMDFIGTNGVPAPKLKQIQKNSQQFSSIYLEMLTVMRLLYQQCKLIHADLSQYNLLYHENKIYVIDVSQSVEHDHPQALAFLQRDIKNINDFFNKKGVKVFSEQEVFQFIVSLDISKGKQREVLEELIENYDGEKINAQAFNKIKIHQNLSSIPVQEVERQLFESTANSITHQTITDIKIGVQNIEPIKEQKNQQSDSDSSSQSSNEQQQTKGQNEDGEGKKQKKEGGKQKYQGLSKLERKHKIKQQKREKRKQKMPKKEKKKLMKKK